MARFRVNCTMIDVHPRGTVIDPERDLPQGADIDRLVGIGAMVPVEDDAEPKAVPNPEIARQRAATAEQEGQAEARRMAREEAQRATQEPRDRRDRK